MSEIFEALNIGRSLGRTGGGPHRRWSDFDDGDDDDFREFTACDSEREYTGMHKILKQLDIKRLRKLPSQSSTDSGMEIEAR